MDSRPFPHGEGRLHRGEDRGLTSPPVTPTTFETDFEPRVVAAICLDEAGVVADFEFREVNAAAAEYFGMATGDLVGERYRSIMPRVEATPFWAHLVRVAETGEPLELEGHRHLNTRRDAEVVVDVRATRAGDCVHISWRDVTDQSLMLAHYRLVAENASDAVFQLDGDTRIRWASPSSALVLGWSPSDLEGTNAVNLLHPDDAAHFAHWADELEQHGATSFEARLRRASGTHSCFAITLRVVTTRDGAAELVGSIRNIDAEVAQRESMRSLSERYQLIAENSLDVVVVGDPDGQILWIFDTVQQLLGWRPDQMIGHHFDEFVHPDDLAEALTQRSAMRRGERITTEVRVRQSDGDYRWIAVTGRDVLDDSGSATTRIVSWRDAEAEVAHQAAMAVSESQYRLLAENASDVVWRTSVDGVLEWVSPSVRDVLGWSPDDLIGRSESTIFTDEDATTRVETRARVLRGERVEPFDSRYLTADGGFRWMHNHYRAITDEFGRVNAIVSSLHDVTALVRGRRGLNTLAAGNAILVRAVSDVDLLTQLCQNLVDEGGFAFAWYDRPSNDVDQTVKVVASSKEHRDYLENVTFTWADNEFGQGPLGRSLRTGETYFVGDVSASANYRPWLAPALAHGFRSTIGLPVFVDGYLDGTFSVYSPYVNDFDVPTIANLENLALQVGIGLQRLREQDRLARALHESHLLNTAIDQATESVLITDASARILYANPSTTMTSGYSIDEMIEQTPAMFASGLHDRDFYRDLWDELESGQSWHGVFTNRRKNGELYDEDTSISPIFGNDDGVMAYVAVKRDLSVERRLEAHVMRGDRDAQDIAALMREVRPASTVAATAELFCDALLRLDFIDASAIFLRDSEDEFVVVGSAGVTLAELEPGRTIDVQNAANFLTRSVDGAWWIDLAEPGGFINEPLVRAVIGTGIEAVTIAPVRWKGDVVGVLATGSRDRAGVAFTPSRLPLYEELGSFAGGLVGTQAEAARHLDSSRRSILSIVENRLFHPVFQPVIDLASGAVVGFEALTRFSDGRPPDEHFALAASAGMSVELEIACAAYAVSEADHLPTGTWFSLNFSPSVIARDDFRRVITATQRDVAIEITEHARIDNFDEVRRAITSFERCRLFVDDAGVGYAGLHHILELQPDVVKLDISLVRDIDHDPARQALVSGMRHFADLTNTLLLGEGVETVEEAETLRSLGVDFGQGYHFGRPAPATSFT